MKLVHLIYFIINVPNVFIRKFQKQSVKYYLIFTAFSQYKFQNSINDERNVYDPLSFKIAVRNEEQRINLSENMEAGFYYQYISFI